MSRRTKIALGVLVVVLVVGAVVMGVVSSASAQPLSTDAPVRTEGRAPSASDARTVVGTYADGTPVYGSGNASDKSPAAVAERSAIAASKGG